MKRQRQAVYFYTKQNSSDINKCYLSLTLQTVSISAGAGGRRGVLGSHDGGKGALLLDGGGHHVGWREREDAGGAAAVGGQAGRRGHGGARWDD